MTVYDLQGNKLNLYDLVEVLEIPNTELLTEKTESDFVYRKKWNDLIKGLVNSYVMINFFHPNDPDPKWYYQGSNEISVLVRHIHHQDENTPHPPSEYLAEFPIGISPQKVRLIQPNPILLYPYGAFNLQVSRTIADPDDPDDPYTTIINNTISPPLETFEICKKILNTPLPKLERLGSKILQKI